MGGAVMSLTVVPIQKNIADKMVIAKHYSHRASIFWAGYALVDGGHIRGVVVYGQPSAPIQRYAFKDRDFRLYELSRLVIQTDTPNAASFLIANSLRQLPKPCAVVSYADMEMNHAGIVYQATNWIYTGATKSHDHQYLVDGKKVHPTSLLSMGITSPKKWAKENGIATVPPQEKHRYFFVCGTKKQKKLMVSKLKYPIVSEYPKTEKTMYDSGPVLDLCV